MYTKYLTKIMIMFENLNNKNLKKNTNYSFSLGIQLSKFPEYLLQKINEYVWLLEWKGE